MARPPKSQDYVVHRIAELIEIADAMQEDEEVRNAMSRGRITFVMADGKCVDINGLDEIAAWVGRLICGDVGGVHLDAKYRPQLLRQIADALERKSGKKRKSGKVDDIAKIRVSWLKAKAEQKGLFRGENPTFKEVAQQYYNLTRLPLDRRSLKAAGFSPRAEAK
jgi:hypothetical protein